MEYTYLFTSCAFVVKPLHESPRHLSQNLSSGFLRLAGFLPERELPGISSSVNKCGPYDTFAIVLSLISHGDAKRQYNSGPLSLGFMQLVPVFAERPPFWNKVYCFGSFLFQEFAFEGQNMTFTVNVLFTCIIYCHAGPGYD